MAGKSCRSFAAAEVLPRIKHQEEPSIGPGVTKMRSPVGIKNSTAFNRFLESSDRSMSLASVGESLLAWSTVIEFCRRGIVEMRKDS